MKFLLQHLFRGAVITLTLATCLAACKEDEKVEIADLHTTGPQDLASNDDLSVSYVGNGCGDTVCTGLVPLCCGERDDALSCSADCGTQVFALACDGPEDCGAGSVCCLTIDAPNTPSHHFAGECKTASACTATLNPSANPIVTARCHTNTECGSYNSILSQCCHNVSEPNIDFCAIPFSTDGGINVVCQN